MKPNLGIIAAGIGLLFFTLLNVLAQTHHVDPWQPVSENWIDSVKKYTDISDWYYSHDYHNPNYVKTLRLAFVYDSILTRREIERKYKVRLK